MVKETRCTQVHGVLSGVRVFDHTHAGIGAFASRMLAAMGAEVVKIEAPGGDIIMTHPPLQRGLSLLYTWNNLGKKSINLDLKKKSDVKAAHELIKKSDVYINNMRPGVVERLGMGYEVLQRINPRLVYVLVNAWGSTGPLRNMPGVDRTVQAMSGFCSIQGAEGGKPELLRYAGHLDETAGAHAASACLQGLLWRQHTGKGQKIEVRFLASAIALQCTRIAEYFAGEKPAPMGSACANSAPHEAFLCCDKKHIAIGVLHDAHWKGLCTALNSPGLLDDPRFATNEGRVKHRAELVPILRKLFQAKPSTWWFSKLTKENVPVGPFYDFETIKNHVHVCENGFVRPVEVPHQGNVYLAGVPWTFSKAESRLGLPPYPGEHTREILGELTRGAKKDRARKGNREVEMPTAK